MIRQATSAPPQRHASSSIMMQHSTPQSARTRREGADLVAVEKLPLLYHRQPCPRIALPSAFITISQSTLAPTPPIA
eukprot:3935395-Rhodomonas_salina.4